MSFWSQKKVLVTGGSGFIASHLCRRLLNEGAELYVLTKYNSVIDNIRLAAFWDRLHVLEADLRNLDSLSQIARVKPQVVFHFAAYNHVGDSFLHVQEALTSNALGTANLMQSYRDYERFVYISTSEVYGYQEQVPFREDQTPSPLSPYSVGKYAGELYARLQFRSHGLPVVLLRPFNAFGPYQSPRAVIAELIIKALRGEVIETTGGEQTRDFNFVENLVDGFMAVGRTPGLEGELINIGSGVETTIKDLVTTIHRLTGSRAELRVGALPYRPGEIWRMFASHEKARSLLGWKPRYTLEQGLEISVAWYRKFLEALLDPASAAARLGFVEP